MRAALAHVLGIVGLLAASFASAQYARELLTDGDMDGFYDVKASEMGKIMISVKLDQLLDTETSGGGDKFVRLDFGGAILSQPLPGDPISFDVTVLDQTTPPTPAASRTSEQVRNIGGGFTQARVFGGDDGSLVAVYRFRGAEIELPTTSEGETTTTYLRVELGNDEVAAGETGTIAADGTGDGYLEVPQDSTAISGSLAVYDNQGDARNGTGTAILSGSSRLLTVHNQIGAATVTAFGATADVASEGGPFRQFVAVLKDDLTGHPGSGKTVGLLAKIDIATNARLLNPASGKPAAVVSVSAAYTVTSTAGNFVGNAEDSGGEAVAMPWMVASDKSCTDGGLTLRIDDDAIDPDDEDNPTTAVEADTATGTHGGTTRYFCVLVNENTATLPVVAGSGPGLHDGYSIDVEPMAGGEAVGVAAMGAAAGSIDRNGTTVNISFLTTHPEYNQRLAIVNRGSENALFWMDNFQTETGTTVVMDATNISGMVPAGGRAIIRIDDHLQLEGIHTRAAGTLNLNAPPVTIDVMTVQFHDGTGTVDTTIYQHN
jgi:hypothetical protein